MTADDLETPLGQNKARRSRKFAALPLAPVVAACLALPVVIFAGWAMFASDPLGGEPMAVAPAIVAADSGPTDTPPEAPPATTPTVTPGDKGAPAGKAPPSGKKTVTIIDGTSGSRREVEIAGTPDESSSAPDRRFSEPSRHGPLPKIASDGTRPADAFARPVPAIAGKGNAPRIAIVMGGLGIGANSTADAVRKLPGPITLAFAPYGGDLKSQIARAREAGHEVLLQVPMEPLDYPDNDPGPQTLLTSLDAGQNLDRLHWLMSRFQGYVGLANFMGSRFSASEQALGPVLRETAKRGLIYFDDSSSTRSLAGQIAGANNLAFAKADVVIDAVPTPTDVDRALARLETAARARGVAVGFAGALPVSIDRIARWAKAAESRGFQLVPITAVVARARSS